LQFQFLTAFCKSGFESCSLFSTFSVIAEAFGCGMLIREILKMLFATTSASSSATASVATVCNAAVSTLDWNFWFLNAHLSPWNYSLAGWLLLHQVAVSVGAVYPTIYFSPSLWPPLLLWMKKTYIIFMCYLNNLKVISQK